MKNLMYLGTVHKLRHPTRGRGGVSQKLTKVDKGGGGGLSEVDVIQLFMILSCRYAFFSYLLVKTIKLKVREMIALKALHFFSNISST